MLFDMLILFIVITLLCLIISIFLMEDRPQIAIPFIMIGMIFTILCTYGFWDVEYFYVGYNATAGNTSSFMYSTSQYGDPYSYVFFIVFWIFVILLLRTGMNLWKEALQTEGQMKYSKRDNRWR